MACVMTFQSFWREYLATLPEGHRHRTAVPEAVAFGDSAGLADELAALVLAGAKRATTSLAVEFSAAGEALPSVGDVCIVLRGDGRPVAVIERIEVVQRPFGEVDEGFAACEGEGDGTLSFWRDAHRAYFGRVCERLGGTFDDRTRVLCLRFEVIWRGATTV